MNDCPFQTTDGSCVLCSLLASSVVNDMLVIVPHEKACEVCAADAAPRSANHVTASLAVGAIHRKDASLLPLALQELGPLLKVRERITLESVGYGVGSELHEVCKENGYDVTPGCQCIPMMARMNVEGRNWCWPNRLVIFSVMKAEFAKRRPTLAAATPEVVVDWRLSQWLREAIRRYDLKSQVEVLSGG